MLKLNQENIRRTEDIRTAHIERLCFDLHKKGIEHRDLIAALLLQAFDLLLAEGGDHAHTHTAFIALADAFAAIRLDQLQVPNVHNQ